jgi:hypothetical protein
MEHSLVKIQPKKYKRFKNATKILNDILQKRMPSEDALSIVYPSEHKNIERMVERLIKDPGFGNDDPVYIRPHNSDAPTIIADARMELENDAEYLDMQEAICNAVDYGTRPKQETMEKYFGEFANAIALADQMFYDLARRTNQKSGMRESMVPLPAHHSRAAALIYLLTKDQLNAAAMRMHDVIEDLLPYAVDKHGKRYGLEEYTRFVNDVIPEKLQDIVTKLTNHYDMIIKYIANEFRRNNISFNRNNALTSLNKKQNDESLLPLHSYIRKIINTLGHSTINGDATAKDELKWLCSRDHYIQEMVSRGELGHNIIELQMKGQGDLSDNGNDYGSVHVKSRIKTQVKTMIYVDYGASLHSQDVVLNNTIAELSETALSRAEDIVLEDMLKQDSVIDNFASGMKKLYLLQSVFYTNKDPAIIY